MSYMLIYVVYDMVIFNIYCIFKNIYIYIYCLCAYIYIYQLQFRKSIQHPPGFHFRCSLP